MSRFIILILFILLLQPSPYYSLVRYSDKTENREQNKIIPNNLISNTNSFEPTIPQTAGKLDLSINMAYPIFAVVKPVFTAAAYTGFYRCFNGYTNYRSCFNRNAIDSWSTSTGAIDFIDSLKADGYPESNIITITDIDVHNGSIFDLNGQPKYNTIVFFHNEYVTLKEYHNMINFIKAGGNVIIFNGNAFFGEVIYEESTNKVKLVSGHGWNFDGENGTRADIYKSRFRNGVFNNEHQSWFGSRYSTYADGKTEGAHFRTNSTNPHPIATEMERSGIDVMSPKYWSFEDNTLITQNAHIIADWKSDFIQQDRGIKIYEMFPEGPNGGSLIHFGFFGTDNWGQSESSRKTFLTSLRHQSGFYHDPWIKYPNDNAVLNNNIVLDFMTGWNTEVYINDVLFPFLERGSSLDFLGEGDYKIQVNFSNANDTIARSVNFSIDQTSPRFLFNNKSTFEIPADFPKTDLTVSMDDLHPNYMKVKVFDGLTRTVLVQETNDFGTVSLTQSLIDGKFISLEGIDEAGNSVVKWYNFNSSANVNVTIEIQPLLEKINETYLKVSIPSISNNVSGRLQVSEDFGVNWINTPFTELNSTTDRVYAYYKRNSSEILYRIAIKANNETHYIKNIKSYNWDNTVYSIKNYNVSAYTRNHTSFMFHLHKSQVQNTSIIIQWLDNNKTIFNQQELGYHLNVDQIFSVNIPLNMSGVNTVRFIVNGSNLIWSKEFQFTAGFPVESKTEVISTDGSVTQLVNLNGLGEDTERIAVIRINFITNGLEIDRTIGISSFGDFTFSVLKNQAMTISSYDSIGNLLKSMHFLKLPDEEGPSIISIPHFFILDNETYQAILKWQVYDNAPGGYEIFQDNILKKLGDFINNKNVEFELPKMEVGIYNFTILTFDKYNNQASYTTMLRVLDSTYIPPSPEISSTMPSSSSQTISSTNADSSNSFSQNTTTKSSTPAFNSIYLGTLLIILTLSGSRSKIRKDKQ